MNPRNTVLVFDSGVGGLSIAQAIHKLRPDLNIVFRGDNKNFPYGTKDNATVTRCVLEECSRFAREYPASVLVLACNTASTVALEPLRKSLTIPVVGVVPAIKPAAALTQTQHIVVLATPATVKRPYTLQLIKDFAKNDRGTVQVTLLGSSRLVEIAEKRVQSSGTALPEDEVSILIKKELEPLVQAQIDHGPIDTIVLACTHFPFLKEYFQKLYPNVLHWLDSGEAVARRVNELVSAGNESNRVKREILITWTAPRL